MAICDAQGLVRPAAREFGQSAIPVTAISATLEEVIALLGANRQQAKLRQTRIGIDHQTIGIGVERSQLFRGREAFAQAAARIIDAHVLQRTVARE